MYILSNSLLQQKGEYRVEVYTMEILGYDAHVEIELKVLRKDELEVYMAEYEIIKSDGNTSRGSILDYDSKEQAIVSVEEVAIRMLEDENWI